MCTLVGATNGQQSIQKHDFMTMDRDRFKSKIIQTSNNNECLISFRFYVGNLETSSKIHQQIVKNPSQIMNKYDSKASLDWFWRQIATRSALRCPPWIKGLSIWSLFGPIWRAKVPCLEPPWVQNVLKIKLLSLGWHVDPPKMVSMRGFGKHMNIY